MASGRFDVVGELLRMRNEHDGGSSIASMHPTRIGIAVIEQALPPPQGQKWKAPDWEHLMQRLPASGFLAERYPELIDAPGVERWLNEFSFLVSYGALRAGESYVIGYWGMFHHGGLTLANRLREDAAFRDDVARAAFDISGAEFRSRCASSDGASR